MAISVYDSSYVNNETANVTHDLGAADNDRMIVVAHTYEGDGTGSSVTCNGEAMTYVAGYHQSASAQCGVRWFILKEDYIVGTGSQTITLSPGSSTGYSVVAWTLYGVFQSENYYDFDYGTATSTTDPLTVAAINIEEDGVFLVAGAWGAGGTVADITTPSMDNEYDLAGSSYNGVAGDYLTSSTTTQTTSATVYAYPTFRHVISSISFRQPAAGDAPTPDPMTWSTTPTATSPRALTMTATTASGDGTIEYYFDCTSHPAVDRDWGTSATYAPTGLNDNTSYVFRVKARDEDLVDTEYSTTATGTTQTDSVAPTPNPSTWSVEPTTVDHQSITMTANTATDDYFTVQYSFVCTTDASFNSGWQSSATHTPTGMTADTSYTFKVQARDTSSQNNTTTYSSEKSATTDPIPATEIVMLDEDWVETNNVDPANYIPQGGSNRAVILVASYEHIVWTSDVEIAAVTLGGESMTEAVQIQIPNAYSVACSIWYLLEDDIPVGSSNYVITWGADGAPSSNNIVFWTATFANIDQDNPVVDTDTDYDNANPTSLSTDVNVIDNGLVVSIIGHNQAGGGSYPISVIEGVTEDDEYEAASSTHAIGSHYVLSDETPRTVSWSLDDVGTPNRAALSTASFRFYVAPEPEPPTTIYVAALEPVAIANVDEFMGVSINNILSIDGMEIE